VRYAVRLVTVTGELQIDCEIGNTNLVLTSPFTIGIDPITTQVKDSTRRFFFLLNSRERLIVVVRCKN